MNDEFVKTDLNEIVNNVKADFELMIVEKNAKIIHKKLPAISGVPLQLHQLFSNLVSNSLKFSNESPVINISSKTVSKNELASRTQLNPSDKYIELKFTDNGIGFEQEYAEKIFEVFQRLYEKQAYSCTGIGLALCKKIVENHNGFIEAQSELGKGATFYVYLPLNNES